MKKIIYFIFCSGIVLFSKDMLAQSPTVSLGTIKHFEKFKSVFVASRNVDVWLPEGYNSKNKYAVLYMNDGEGLFDSALLSIKQEWGVDEAVSKLLNQGKIKNCIVVAIWSTDMRHSEYFPQKPFEQFSKYQQDSLYKIKYNGSVMLKEKIQSDNYLKFLVKELKPFIDKTFNTISNQKNTFIAGSSMGGLISMYAICKYPKIFGGAACMSTHWWGLLPAMNNPVITNAFLQYLQSNAPSAKNHKLYFDTGTLTVDLYNRPLQVKVDSILQTKGYNQDNYLSKEFAGADHSVKSWRARIDVPVAFLLGKKL
jgi:enterochelin esterase-like enzyme